MVPSATLVGKIIFGDPTPALAQQDFVEFFEFARHYVLPAEETTDGDTGFVIGGKNATSLIRRLRSINGRGIAELEKDMRPGAEADVGSDAGFLGAEESLLEILAADNDYVINELGLTHHEIARHLHAMGSIASWQAERRTPTEVFVYRGRRFKVSLEVSRGTQLSPFRDGTDSGSNVTVTNIDNEKVIQYGLLVPYMIDRYGFYEGHGTLYRVDPKLVVEVFDFLTKE